MPDPIDDDFVILKFEQNPVISNTEAKFRRKIGETPDITSQIHDQFLDSSEQPLLITKGQSGEVLDSFRFESEFVFQIKLWLMSDEFSQVRNVYRGGVPSDVIAAVPQHPRGYSSGSRCAVFCSSTQSSSSQTIPLRPGTFRVGPARYIAQDFGP